MNSISVLIVEDNPIELVPLVKVLEVNNYTIAGVASSHKEALELMFSVPFDLAIIDVYLNGNPDGIAFAETLSSHPEMDKPFVFLTSSRERGIFDRAKLTAPYAFLLKPFNELEVIYALEMAFEKRYGEQHSLQQTEGAVVASKQSLFVKSKGSLIKIMTEDIAYIQVEDRYCTIFTNGERFVVMLSLKKMLELLDEKRFIRTHRNFIVNQLKIDRIILNENSIILEDKQSVPLSENYKEMIKKLTIIS